MIHISKAVKHIPNAWLVKAIVERRAAIAAFKKPKAQAARKFKFRAYSDVVLRDTLNKLFSYKCAYCESFFGATQPVAIEHFRPKKEVVEGNRRFGPGYYWLAAEWSNLFPSCTDCNSRRAHLFGDGRRIVRGKGNEFPIANPAKRAKRAGYERFEKPLLLNPSSGADPRKHLEFAIEVGAEGIVRPVVRRGKGSIYGTESIRVYALDRPLLIKARKDYASRFIWQCRNTEKALRERARAPQSRPLAQEYDLQIRELRSFLDPDKPYLGMVWQIVNSLYPSLRI